MYIESVRILIMVREGEGREIERGRIELNLNFFLGRGERDK